MIHAPTVPIIVALDADGFVHIKGRLKRFAKIGGEMVSLAAVEEALDHLYPEAKQGVLAVADEQKGEKLVLITSAPHADIAAIHDYFKAQGINELWLPKQIVYTANPPLLASGKFDYREAEKLL